MEKLKVRARLAIVMATALTVAAVAGGVGTPLQATAAPPAATGSGGGTTASQGQGSGATSGAEPVAYKNFLLKGGYVSAGVGLRNRGAGNISLGGIPSGAKVKAAYLYWSILGATAEPFSYRKGSFAGTSITGTKVGSGATACWPSTTTGYAYRAEVTAKVKGNGNYSLAGFASGATDARDAFATAEVPPLAEGASLVVVFEKSTYPETRVVIKNGYTMVSSAPGASTWMSFGFPASNPVGTVKTTFIGGDGQSNATEPPSLVNGVPIAAADWDGTDGPLPRYSAGNLWDTDTVNLVNVVKPGHTGATVRVQGGSDCLAWVAQVLSIGRNGNLDTDGDKLKDGWEANGYDANNDGIIDVNLPAMGATDVHKDLFVEMDYMGAQTTCPCYLPQTADLNRIVSVFAGAPQANNPDGKGGIRLHLDAGAARGAAYNLGGGNLVPLDLDLSPAEAQFDAIKAANFSPRRAKIFYYMIWAHGYNGGSSSGNAFDIPNDKFVVTLGNWGGGGTPDQKVGTFIHEFGHALGQQHGGTDGTNYKPNYLSVMNYAFQTTGVTRTGTTAPYFGYSYFTLPSLNETKLDERKGLQSSAAQTFRTKWFCPSGSAKTSATRSDKDLDWNCKSGIQALVSTDINGDGSKSTLSSYNNWGHITYGGGDVGAGVSAWSAPKKLSRELTYEEHLRMR